ncbi:putative NADH-ubiquinone oxidoreductase complex 1/LYR family protein [Zalerion maritima]|uniref:NADH-ubiquinone oxidoreductase complex 1/LYR family protein n=1 Tax=Zalerion maritima TaxID=339359 RepID=A0AAD5RW42_9PEZI|nr:putative NADH-ubiquinone oxidoreductase complex 1/LYR family protein [Zalerion maritima]
MALNPALRRQVISLYKELIHLGKEWPQGFDFFRSRLHSAFMKKSHLEDEEAIKKGIAQAEYIKKEVEAL